MKLRSILAFARSVAKARALTLQDDGTEDCHSGTNVLLSTCHSGTKRSGVIESQQEEQEILSLTLQDDSVGGNAPG